MGSTCLLDDVLMTVDGSRSTSGPGGFLHVAGGGRTIVAGRTTNTDATNVTLSCREGSYISAGIGVGGGGGCIYVDNGSVDVDVRGCVVRECLSCMGPGLLSRGDEAGNIMLVSNSQSNERVSLVTKSTTRLSSCNRTTAAKEPTLNMSCAILYLNGYQEPPQCVVGKTSWTSTPTTSPQFAVKMLDSITVLSTTGTVLSPPDVVVGAQIIRTVWSCASSVDKSSQQEQRRPYLSLGGWVSISKSNVAEWELMLLMCSGAVVYCVHGLLTWVMTVYHAKIDPTRKHKNRHYWIESVQQCSYPSYSIQYNQTLLLPIVSASTVIWYSTSTGTNIVVVFFGMVPMLIVGMVACCVHTSSLSSSLLDFSIAKGVAINPNDYWTTYLFIPYGQWKPSIVEAMGGPLFSEYAIPFSFRFYPSRLPFVWFWITLFVGVVSTIVASISEFSTEPQGK
eukprot:PhF_6_TR42969/c0_g1_i3/m.65397